MSNWKKSPFRTQYDLRDRWPIAQELSDPWAGDECFYPFDQSELHQALLCSDNLREHLSQYKQKGLNRALLHDGAPLQKCLQPCHETLLANITEDWVPDIGLFAQERVLGPFAPFEDLQVLCGAILCFSPLLKHGITPAGRFGSLRGNTRSASIGVQAKAPAMIWNVDAQKNIQPILPLSSPYIPLTPIDNLPPNSTVLARIIPTKEGWKAYCVLPIPLIGTKYIWNRLFLEWLEFQRCNKRIFWEDILRYRSELLYRSALEYCFFHAQEETRQCWLSYFLPATLENSPPSPPT